MMTATLSPAPSGSSSDARPTSTDTVPTRTATVPTGHATPRPFPATRAHEYPDTVRETGRWRRLLRRLTNTHDPVPPQEGGPHALRDIRDAQIRDVGFHARIL